MKHPTNLLVAVLSRPKPLPTITEFVDNNQVCPACFCRLVTKRDGKIHCLDCDFWWFENEQCEDMRGGGR